MTPADRRLLRHLVAAVTVKLVLLTAIWWGFVRDERVSIDSEAAGARIGAGATVSTPQGEMQ
jgi:hypothetical protein